MYRANCFPLENLQIAPSHRRKVRITNSGWRKAQREKCSKQMVVMETLKLGQRCLSLSIHPHPHHYLVASNQPLLLFQTHHHSRLVALLLQLAIPSHQKRLNRSLKVLVRCLPLLQPHSILIRSRPLTLLRHNVQLPLVPFLSMQLPLQQQDRHLSVLQHLQILLVNHKLDQHPVVHRHLISPHHLLLDLRQPLRVQPSHLDLNLHHLLGVMLVYRFPKCRRQTASAADQALEQWHRRLPSVDQCHLHHQLHLVGPSSRLEQHRLLHPPVQEAPGKSESCPTEEGVPSGNPKFNKLCRCGHVTILL